MKYDIFNGNIRALPRAEFVALRRAARRSKCSYRFGRFYIGVEVTPCDASGVTIRGVQHKIDAAQWARAQATKARNAESRARWIQGAREILALPHAAPLAYWLSRFA
jgi:hypothetical protein